MLQLLLFLGGLTMDYNERRTQDLVQESSATEGLDDMELGGPITHHRAWSDVFEDGSQVLYAIRLDGAEEWEVGEGVLVHGTPDVLERTTVLASSAGGAKVDFSGGTKVVYSTVPAAQLMERAFTPRTWHVISRRLEPPTVSDGDYSASPGARYWVWGLTADDVGDGDFAGYEGRIATLGSDGSTWSFTWPRQGDLIAVERNPLYTVREVWSHGGQSGSHARLSPSADRVAATTRTTSDVLPTSLLNPDEAVVMLDVRELWVMAGNGNFTIYLSDYLMTEYVGLSTFTMRIVKTGTGTTTVEANSDGKLNGVTNGSRDLTAAGDHLTVITTDGGANWWIVASELTP